jgi:hypothetical protein
VFVGLWDNLGRLVSDGRFIAPLEVLRELERGDDELLQWARDHREMFKPVDEEVWKVARGIAAELQGLVDHTKQSADADIFVVALALAQPITLLGSCAVVAHERPRAGRVRIVDACAHYGIEYMGLQQMFAREGWRFE